MTWYTEKTTEDAAQIARDTEGVIKTDLTGLINNWARYIGFYKDRFVNGFEPNDWYYKASNHFRRVGYTDQPELTHNVVRSCIDTVVAKITAHQPKAKFLTSGAFENTQEKAKDLEKFVDGVVYSENAYKKAALAFRDACICGTGVLKVFCDGDSIKIERVHVSRLRVDPKSISTSCKTKQIFQTDFVSREKLIKLFPKKKAVIKDVAAADPAEIGTDMIEVIECWYEGTEENPGRHLMLAGEDVLLDEKWTQGLPFVVIRYSDDVLGWYGLGLAEVLTPIQIEINEVVQKVQNNMNLLAVPFILKHKSTNIPDEFIADNRPAKIIEWEGNVPPQVVTPPAINPQVIQYLDKLYAKAFELARVSMLSALAVKPAGLNSGIALRTHHDIETQNFAPIARAWEQFFVDLALHIVGAAKQAASTNEDLSVTYLSSNKIRSIKWKDVDLEEDKYELTVDKASSLPQTAAGRVERVTELMQSGMVSVEEGRSLLDFPDLEKYNRLSTAALDDIEATFEHMLVTGKYVAPSKFQNLDMGIKLGVSYLIRAKLDGLPESKTDLIEQWLEEANELMMPPPPPEMMPPPGAPIGIEGGGPVPPPQGPEPQAGQAPGVPLT